MSQTSCSSTQLDYKERLFRSVTRFQDEENAFREEAAALKNKILKVGEHMHNQFGKVRERMVFMHELDKTVDTSDSSELVVKGKADSLTTGTVSSNSNSAQKESVFDDTDQMAQRLIAHLTALPREKRLSAVQKLLLDLGKLCAENEKKPVKEEGQKIAKTPQLMNGETVPLDLTEPPAPRDSFTVAIEEVAEHPAPPICTAPPSVQPTGVEKTPV